MPPHIDRYRHEWSAARTVFLDRIDDEEARALARGQEELGFSLPYFGDYVVITAVHEDGECADQGVVVGPFEPIELPNQAA